MPPVGTIDDGCGGDFEMALGGWCLMVRLRQGALSNVAGRGYVEVRTCCKAAIGRRLVWRCLDAQKESFAAEGQSVESVSRDVVEKSERWCERFAQVPWCSPAAGLVDALLLPFMTEPIGCAS
jgi:hypothetical protein